MIRLFTFIKFLKNSKIKSIIFYVLIFLLCGTIAITSQNYDYDLWARLVAGMAIVQTGQILQQDFLSYTPTHDWYDHEWGASVVFYLFQHHLGYLGLLFLQILLMFLTFFVLAKAIKLRYGEKYDCKFILIYFVAIHAFAVTYHSLIRCHSFTFLFFVLELYILEYVRKTLNYKVLLVLPLLFVIWGNTHGGVVSGLGILFLYAIGEALNKKDFKYYLAPALICPLMLFINPYGPNFVVFLFKAVSMPRPHVVEWWHIFRKLNYKLFMPFKLLSLFYIIVETSKVIYNKFNLKSLDKTKFLVLLITLILAVKHVKMMPFFALAGTLFCYGDVMELLKRIKMPNWCNNALYMFLMIFSIYVLSVAQYRPLINFNVFPIMEVEFLKVNKIEGNLLVNFGIGSYAAYKLYPQNKIYMDGRYEEVYDDELMVDMDRLFGMKWGFYSLLAKNKPDIIILEKNYSGLYNYLQNDSKNWSLVFSGMNYGVFVDRKILKDNYNPPNGNIDYYRKTVFNTSISFKGENAINIYDVNYRSNLK